MSRLHPRRREVHPHDRRRDHLASDEAFNRPMGPFYLNGGGFNGARYLVKGLKVTALPGSPQTRTFIPLKPAAPTPKSK
ncbi:MAG: hypothetical protein EBQ59_00965 [Verrucomicrobia bacterium]|nr:hypothetical protein [Verrucomicrobiota bacterium]